MRTMTSNATALINSHRNLNEDGMPEHTADLTYIRAGTDLSYWFENSYTLIGTAEITVTVFDKEVIIENKINALREEVKGIKAEAHAKCTKIEGQIQDLLAISFSAPVMDDDSIPF